MDDSQGVLTTVKLQALLDSGRLPDISNRQSLAEVLSERGRPITVHGINAWFRRVESNYSTPRDSLSGAGASFPVPKQRWREILEVFGVDGEQLSLSDREFVTRWLGGASGNDRPTQKAVTDPGPAMVGRKAELGHLLDGLEAAKAGHGGIFFLEGTAGIGKSRLIEHFRERAERHCVRVIQAICVQGSVTPLLPIVEAMSGALAELEHIDPAIAADVQRLAAAYFGTGASSEPRMLQAQLALALVRASTLTPLVFVVDDAHWLDDTSRQFIEQLAHRQATSRSARLQVIAGYRPNERHSRWPDTVARFRGKDGAAFLAIEPMTESEIGQLLESCGPRLARPAVSALWEASGGNPLYAKQLHAFLRDKGFFREVNGYWVLQSSLQDADVPRGIGSFFLGAFRELGEQACEVVTYAACLGREFSVHQLGTFLTELSLEEIAAALDEAEDKGIVKLVNPRCCFAHPLARFAALQNSTSSRIAHIHYRIARQLKQSGTDTNKVDFATHMVRGAMYADADELADVLYEAIASAHGLGAWDQVLQFASTLKDLGPAALSFQQAGHVHRWSGDAWHKKGRPDEALASLFQASALFEKSGDRVGYAAVLNDIVHIRGNFGKVEPGDLSHAEELARQLDQQSHEPSLPLALSARIRGTLAMQHVYAGENEVALRLTDEGQGLLAVADDDRVRCYLAMIRGIAFLNRLEVRKAGRCFDSAFEHAERTNDVLSAAQSQQRRAIVELATGNPHAAIERARDAESYGSLANQTGELALPISMRITAHLALDQPDQALNHCRRGLEVALISRYSWGAIYLVLAYAQALCRAGETEQSVEMMRSLLVNGRFFENPERYRHFVELVEMYVRTCAGQAPDPALVARHEISPLRESNCDLLRLCRYGFMLELATRAGLRDQARVCRAALQTAMDRGIVCTPGWYFDLPVFLLETAAA